MKNKKSQFKSMLSSLMLMLTVSVILTLPDAESNNSDSLLQQSSVEEAPNRDEDAEPRAQPLTDLDEQITVLRTVKKYTV